MNLELSCRGMNGVLICNIQKINICNNFFDYEDDGKFQGYINECKLNYVEVKKEFSQKIIKLEIKIMKIFFIGILDKSKICFIYVYNIY